MVNCPKCGTSIEAKWKLCPECGERLSGASAASGGSAHSGADGHAGNGTGVPRADVSLGDMRTLAPVGAGKRGDGASFGGISLADRYELGAELGRGGFALVSKARDKKLNRTVAVKRLLSGAGSAGSASGTGTSAAERQTVERFRRDAQLIAPQNHRSIVQVLDHDCDLDGDYIVMEYVDGGTLRDYLKSKGGKLPLFLFVRIPRQ